MKLEQQNKVISLEINKRIPTRRLQYQYVIEHAAWDGWTSWILDYSRHICKDGP